MKANQVKTPHRTRPQNPGAPKANENQCCARLHRCHCPSGRQCRQPSLYSQETSQQDFDALVAKFYPQVGPRDETLKVAEDSK